MDFDVREMLVETIKRYLDRFCRDNELDPVWGEPIVGFGDARSPRFAELRTVVHPEHYLPEDILPGATTVVSYYLPFTKDVARGNIPGDLASPEFAYTVALTNSIAMELADEVATDIRAYDYEAEIPDWERIDGDIVSRWSQRHVAYLCGMGTWGINNMIITDEGCCGRFFSIVDHPRRIRPLGMRQARRRGPQEIRRAERLQQVHRGDALLLQEPVQVIAWWMRRPSGRPSRHGSSSSGGRTAGSTARGRYGGSP